MYPFNFLRSRQRLSALNSSYVSSRLTREGLQFAFILLFIVLAAILQSINLLVLIAGAFLAIFVIQWRLTTRTLSDINVHRLIPSSIQARRVFSVQLVLENPRRRLGSWLLMIHDHLVPSETPLGLGAPGHGITMMLNRLLPKQTKSLHYECQLPVRGSYCFSAPLLTTRFPFSLMRGSRSLPLSQKILIHPTQGTLDQSWRDALRLPEQGKIQRQSSAAGGDGEFFGLRDYRSGDSIRYVHWRTSAKRGELVIRQFEREESQAMSLILDLGPFLDEIPMENAGSELAIELVASIIARVVSIERSVVTLTMIDTLGPVIAKVQANNQLTAALDRLAMVQIPKMEALSLAIRQTIRFTGGREPIVVISTRSKQAFIANHSNTPKSFEEVQRSNDKTMDSATESRIHWIDVTNDPLNHFFIRG